MPIDAKIFRRARRGDISASIAVLRDCFPLVHRLAFALGGSKERGKSVVDFVMRRGVRQIPKWSDESDPPRWCRHHTLLATRRVKRKTDPAHDTLLAPDDEPQYIAFIKAIRALPMQQREAIILTHGEDFGIRSLAIAMDCSQEAAQMHLREASRVLSELSGAHFESFAKTLHKRYQSLVPSEAFIATNLQREVKRYLWPRKVWSWIRFCLIVVIVAAIILFAWKIYPMLVY